MTGAAMDSKRERKMPEPAADRQMPYDDEEWADRLEIARARREKVLAARAAQKAAEAGPEAAPVERLKSALRGARPTAAAAAPQVPHIRAERREAEPEIRERPQPQPRARRSRRSGRSNLYLATLLVGVAAGSVATVKVMNWLQDDVETSASQVLVEPAGQGEATPAATAAPAAGKKPEAAPAVSQEDVPVETGTAAAVPDPEPAAPAKPQKAPVQKAEAQKVPVEKAEPPKVEAPKVETQKVAVRPPVKPVARPAERGATAPAKPAEDRTASAEAPADPKADAGAEKVAETQPATTGTDALRPPASESTVRIYAPRSVAAGELDAVGATLRDEGIVKQSADRVGYSVGTAQVRYYHAGDAGEAQRIARAVNATARDFTDHQPAPAEGTLEVYLAGTSPRSTTRRAPEPPLAEATAAVQGFVSNLAAQIRQGR